VPLTLILLGIVLRGSAFIFRSYDADDSRGQRYWGRVFAVASLVTPLLLGVGVGAIAAGRVRPPSGAGFVADFLRPWLSPFTLSVGLLTLLLFAFLAAVYLTLETTDPPLQEDFRGRALWAGLGVFAGAVLSLGLAWREAPLVWTGLVTAPRAAAIHFATGLVATVALLALWRRRYRLARVAAAAQVSLILWGWALAQYPALIPPDLTLTTAAAPAITLELTLGALAVGATVLLPSLWYLFRVFKLRPLSGGPADGQARTR
jgi:cytochrome d ubiquinol oxidase subunit II